MSGYDYNDDGYNGMPDPADAAQNLERFVSWFGDGEVYGNVEDEDGLPLCHSRDIEALIYAYRELAETRTQAGVLRTAASFFPAVNVKLSPEDARYVADWLRSYADRLEGNHV